MRMVKTVVAVALLIPGLILSLFKLAAYASSAVRDKHALVKEAITETGRCCTRITQSNRKIYSGPLTQTLGKRISLEDVTKIKVSENCAETFPCQHRCVVTLNDMREAADLDSYDICAIVSSVAADKIVIGKNWDVNAIRTHFSQYQPTKSVEETLNGLLFE